MAKHSKLQRHKKIQTLSTRSIKTQREIWNKKRERENQKKLRNRALIPSQEQNEHGRNQRVQIHIMVLIHNLGSGEIFDHHRTHSKTTKKAISFSFHSLHLRH